MSASSRCVHRRRLVSRSRRLFVEPLEDRRLLTTRNWTGNGADDLWSNAANWDTGVPISGDDVVIAATANSAEVLFDGSVPGGSVTVNSLSSAEPFHITGSTLALTGAGPFTMTAGLSLAGGDLGGSGTLTVSPTMDWTAGSMDGGGTLVIPSGSSLNISSDTFREFNGHTINNSGTITWTGAANLRVDAGTNVITNQSGGVFNAQNNSILNNNSSTLTFNNQSGATFNKSGAGTTSTFAVTFNNDLGGTVNVNSGTLALGAGGTDGGAFNVASGGTLAFSGGTHNLGATSSVSGAGDVIFTGATANLGGSYAITGSTNISDGSANFNATATTTDANLSGVGNLGGSGTLTVNGTMGWTAGSMSGGGTLAIASGANLNISTNTFREFLGHTINNSGTITWTGAANIRVDNGTNVINNQSGGVFNAQNDSILNNNSSTLTFNNQSGATFNKSGAGTTSTFAVTFNNDLGGTVNVNSGTLALGAGGTSGGAFVVASGGTLAFSGGTHNLGATSSVSGAGDVIFTGATANLGGSYAITGSTNISDGSANFNATATTTDANLSGVGNLGGSGTLTVNGTMGWTAGSMSGGGTLAIASGANLNISTNTFREFLGHTINNSGTITWTGAANIRVDNGTNVINNQSGGIFNAQNEQLLNNNSSTLTFNNEAGAIFNKSGPGTLSNFAVTFNNDLGGTVNVVGGLLALGAGGTSGGTFSASGGTLVFSGGTHNLTATSSVSGAAGVNFTGATVNVGGSYAVTGATNISGGSANFNASATATTVNLNGGTLGGSGTLTVNSTMDWTAGSLADGGILAIASGAILNISADTFRQFLGHTINNSGTITWTGAANIRVDGGTNVINNQSGGVFNAQNNSILNNNSSTLTFNNQSGATFNKSGAGTTSTFAVAFNNAGTINVSSGTLQFGSTFVQTAGATHLVAGSIATTSSLDIQGGTLDGNGTITGDVNNSGGTLSPGSSGAGAIEIAGNYVQTDGTPPSGEFSVEIGGLTPVTQYDQVMVTGANHSATLAGTLTATLINGFVPNIGDSFTILQGPASGNFDTLNLPPLPPGRQWSVSIGSVVLTVVPAAVEGVDLAVSKTDSPDPVTAGNNLTYTISLTNNGLSDASNATLTDAVPVDTTFVSATQTAGPTFTLTKPAVNGTGNFIATIGTFDSGATATFTMVVHVNSSTPTTSSISNTVTASSNADDANPDDNTASATTSVIVSADVAVTKTGPASVVAGQDITYTITATNNGPSDAQNVQVSDIPPDNTTLVSFTQDSGPPGGSTLPASGVETFTLVLHVSATAPNGSTLTNTAQVSTTTSESDTTNNQSVVNTTVNAQTDVSVTKTGSATVTAGGQATYTITITNNGPLDAQSVSLTDTLPAVETFVSASTGTGSGTSYSSGNLGTLAAGASTSITIVAAVSPAAASGAVLTNRATASTTTPEPNTANNTGTFNSTVATSADVAITKTGPATANAGQNITYTLSIADNGPSNAQNVSVSDTLPAGETFVSASTGTGSGISYSSGNLGTLAAGGSTTITIVAAVSASMPNNTLLHNSATVSTSTSDPNNNNNTATFDTTVSNLQPDVVLTKTGPATVTAGTQVTYTLSLTNSGAADAQNVSLTDTLPAGETFVSASTGTGSGTSYSSGNLGTLAIGGSTTITIVAAISPGAANGAVLTNRATTNTTTTESSTANNIATFNSTVTTTADVAVTKTGPGEINIGQNLTYTIVVNNAGPSAAQNVSLNDAIPTDTRFVSATQIAGPAFTLTKPPAGGTGTFTATTGSFSSGGSATFRVVVHVNSTAPESGQIENTAIVATTTTDTNTANNTAATSADIEESPLGLPECNIATLNAPGAARSVVLQDDADNPGQNVLLVTGSNRSDVIVIEPRPVDPSQIRVKINGVTVAIVSASNVQRIVAYGLNGNDTIVVNATLPQSATLFGGNGNDYLFGGAGDDQISGGAGNDHLFGVGGDDTLCGDEGNDFVYGGLGNDTLFGEGGNDHLFGEAGDDLLIAGAGNDFAYGGIGNDQLFGQQGNDQLFGDPGDDVVVGGDGNDKLFGSTGRDLLIGGNGADQLFGEANDDILIAGSTTFDESQDALSAILAEWTSTNDYSTRIDNLRTGGGASAGFTLDSTTVLDDGAIDTLWGQGGQDWFLAGTRDKVKDRAPNEMLN